MIGKKFGNFVVEGMAGVGPRGCSWLCRCSCGELVKLGEWVLTTGGRQSCGCWRKPVEKRVKTPQGLGIKYKSTYVCWSNMISRCHTAKKQACYNGITICDRWYKFENFLEDMGERPSKEYSVDRIDPEKGYSPENCRWLLLSENCRRVRKIQSEEKSRRLSEGVKRAHAEGKILTPEVREKIGKGGLKRTGRKLQKCTKCGQNSYLPLCQRCRGGRKPLPSGGKD